MKDRMNNVMRFFIVFIFWTVCSVTKAQTTPFVGEAVVNLGADQSVQELSKIMVPVNIDLSGLTAADINAVQVPAALGVYFIVVHYDAAQLSLDLSNSTIPGGSNSQFSSSIEVNSSINGNNGLLAFSFSQLEYDAPTGVIHVADIPFTVIGQGGDASVLSVVPLDLRTTLSRVNSPVSLVGGESIPFTTLSTQISILDNNNPTADTDKDGVLDINDAFPLDPAESVDTDGDGIGNNADTDDDNDGVLDASDAFPLDASESVDTDGDGVGDNSDPFPLDASLPTYVHSGILHEFDGLDSYDDFGAAVSGHGDINADGISDILIGAYQYVTGGTGGYVHAYSGADGSLLFSFPGDYNREFFGRSVEIVKDVNGDGHDEMLIGAPGDCLNATSFGRATLYSGFDGSIIYTFDGVAASDCFGYAVDSAGDVNRDGVTDMVIGTESSLYVQVYSGVDGALLHTLQATTVNEAVGSSVSHAGDVNNDGYDDVIAGVDSGDYAEVFSGFDGSSLMVINEGGQTVSAAGDVNGDGYDDVAVAKTDFNTPGVLAGRVNIYSGQNGSVLRSVTGDMSYENFGTSLDAADLNQDGYVDLVVGTSGADLRDGRVEVLSGIDDTSLSNIKLGNNADEFGRAVSVLGDINGDGVPEIIIGAAQKTVSGLTYAGGVYIIASQLDSDGDGVADIDDQLPLDDGEQVDTDGDGIGNNADTDDDNDGVLDAEDAFPLDATESVDTDGDGIGNNADTDDDNDGVLDTSDAFPLDATESVDTDSDGIGNNADSDDDNDGVLDAADAFPLDASESVDTDSDGIGNNADLDDDNDGVLDAEDAFPLDATESVDTDGDGIGNNADTDDDNDGVLDAEDVFPLDATESVDTDGDGIGNNADTDDDNDGVLDEEDAFPLDATESVDTDGDGIGNNADTDDDNDGVLDADDAFPLDATESVDTDGDGIGNNADTDDDNDGVLDADDAFPLDATESVDTDGDGIGNNTDSDDDNDGVLDVDDAFPLDATESVDTDGDGIGDNADTDNAPVGVPTIDGIAAQGEILTVNISDISDVDGLGAFSYQWQSNGVAITGAISSTYTLTQSEVGTSISVVISYTDGGGTTENLTSASTGLVIGINDAPSTNITTPLDASSYTQGDSIAFSGIASDAEDGDLSTSLSWSSSIDGVIGRGANITINTLNVGAHTITATVTDSGGLTSTSSINITVDVDNLLVVATPAFTPVGGSYTDSVTITLTTSTAGATIYYSTDGSEPSSSSIAYGGAFTLTQSATVKAIALVDGYQNSEIATASYNVMPATSGDRIISGLKAEYRFTTGSGPLVYDQSGVAPALDLEIQDVANTNWLQCGGLSVTASTVIMAGTIPTKITAAIKASNAASIEAWVKPASTSQSGPARIVTLSAGAYDRNFTLGQDNSKYDVRFRTTTTSSNGVASTATSNQVVSTELTHVLYTRDAVGVTSIYVNGVLVKSGSIGGDTSNWDDNYVFALVNEVGTDRTWLGELHLVAVYDRALSASEVQQNYTAGIYVTCNRPTAEAGVDQTVMLGDAIQLDGSDSSDPEGDLLSYAWSVTGQPSGSNTIFSDATAVNPTLSVDQSGIYTIALIVNDGVSNSLADTVTVNVDNPLVVATPAFTPVGGSYTDSVTITLTTSTAGATIYYSTDGSEPSSSSIAYGGAFTLTQSATVKAIALVDGYQNSEIATASYNVMPATSGDRIISGLKAEYRFTTGSGPLVYDQSGVAPALDLEIQDVANTNWLQCGGLSVTASTVIMAGTIPTKITAAIKTSNAASIEAWVKPASTSQSGPARIVTLSAGAYDRNFTLGQDNSKYDVRFRTTTTSSNGVASTATSNQVVSTELTHVLYTRDAVGVTSIYVNGVLVKSGSIGGDTSNWDDNYVFALVNEVGTDRTWLGELHLVAVYDRALSASEVQQNYTAGIYDTCGF